MAGLGRIQQWFNAAVVTLLALAGLRKMTGADAKAQAAKGSGHPIHAKLLKSSNPKGNTSGHAYTGYHSCSDRRRAREIARYGVWINP